jgi:phage FluMu protein Com
MPIQFRCGSCQQLLGIARRKAGMIVSCPTCRQKTRVPYSKEEPSSVVQSASAQAELTSHPAPAIGEKSISIFDRVDVERLLSVPRPSGMGHAAPLPLVKGEKGGWTERPAPALQEEPAHPLPDPLLEEKPVLQRRDAPESGVAPEPPYRLSTVHKRAGFTFRRKALFAAGVLLLAAGAFYAGHWFGTHRPLF